MIHLEWRPKTAADGTDPIKHQQPDSGSGDGPPVGSRSKIPVGVQKLKLIC